MVSVALQEVSQFLPVQSCNLIKEIGKTHRNLIIACGYSVVFMFAHHDTVRTNRNFIFFAEIFDSSAGMNGTRGRPSWYQVSTETNDDK